jgi:hypothetical protein
MLLLPQFGLLLGSADCLDSLQQGLSALPESCNEENGWWQDIPTLRKQDMRQAWNTLQNGESFDVD